MTTNAPPAELGYVLTVLGTSSTTFTRLQAIFDTIAKSPEVPPTIKTLADLGKALATEFANDTDILRGEIEAGGIAP